MEKKIQDYFKKLNLEPQNKEGVFYVSFTLAKRDLPISKRSVDYKAKYKIDEEKKIVYFNEMLKEINSGFLGSDDSPFGVTKKSEVYQVSSSGRAGKIKETSKIANEEYAYTFDFGKIRRELKEIVESNNYKFKYKIFPWSIR